VVMIHQHQRQMDGQTDDMRLQDRALHRSASRGKSSSSPTDMHIHDSSTLDNHMTLGFWVTSGSTRGKQLPFTVCLPSLVLIVQAVFLLEYGHTGTHKVTGATDNQESATANVGN